MMSKINNVAVIAGYSRSAFTPAKKGKLSNVKPDDLLSEVIKNLILSIIYRNYYKSFCII